MKNKESNFVSAVAYVYNNEKEIVEFLNTLVNTLTQHFDNSEIIIVNGFSIDNTVNIVKEYAKSIEGISITLLNLSNHYGLEVAMNAGTDLSIGDFVFEFDNVLVDYPVKTIYDTYCKSLKGYDIVSTSANRTQKISSKIYYKLFNAFSDFSSELTTETFRVLSRRAINRVRGMNKVTLYRKASYNACGLKNLNIKYDTTKNIKDKNDSSYRFNLAIESLLTFTNFGYKFSLITVGVMLLISVCVAIYTLVIFLLGIPVQGWTTTIMFLAIAFFGLFSVLALIIKYLQIILKINIQTTSYNFESIEKLSE